MPRIRSSADKTDQIWQLKITLKGSKPPIWRRIQVPGSISLYKLHQIIQTVMPWQTYHLYEFQVGETEYGEPDPGDKWFGREVKNARRATLSQVAPEIGAKLRYTYDFGDNWEHAIVVDNFDNNCIEC